MLESQIFIAVFTGEVLIKITALGWIRGPESYLRNPWHYLDLVCVIGMWVDVSGAVDVSGLATIRLLRILRLLAMVLTFESVRAAYQGLAIAMEEVMMIAIIVFMNILVFVSVSVQMYGGMYASCSHAGDANMRESCMGEGVAYLTYIHNGDTMISVPRTWESPGGNFDDFGHALLSSISMFLNLVRFCQPLCCTTIAIRILHTSILHCTIECKGPMHIPHRQVSAKIEFLRLRSTAQEEIDLAPDTFKNISNLTVIFCVVSPFPRGGLLC
jgi:hypothetical protein